MNTAADPATVAAAPSGVPAIATNATPIATTTNPEGTEKKPSPPGSATSNKPASSKPSTAGAPLATPDSPRTAERKKKILAAFTVFDSAGSKSCDVREVGTVLRSLDIFLSEETLQTFLKEIQQPENPNLASYEKFEPLALRLLDDTAYVRDDEDRIYRAFHVLDRDNKGFVTVEELKMAMSTEGEPLSTEELEELLNSCVDQFDGKIYYDKYAIKLASC